MKISLNKNHIYYLSLIILLFACNESIEWANPLDPDNPNWESPSVTIDMTDSEIVNNTVTISWQGNVEDSYMQFRSKLNDEEWLDYSTDTQRTLSYLDDTVPNDQHIFYVEAIYNNNSLDKGFDSILFKVDAIDGPSFRVLPMRQEVAEGHNFNIEIIAEEVEDIRYFECVIEYDSQYISYNSNQQGDVFQNELFFVDDGTPGTITISAGEISILDVYTGTGSIIELTFSAEALTSATGTAITITTESAYFDVEGNAIEVNQRKEGLVVIQ